MGLIFRNGLVHIGPKFKHGFGTQEGHSALLECRLAQIAGKARGLLDEVNLTIFNFLEIRTRLNSYLIIQLIF